MTGRRKTTSLTDKIHFGMISLVHGTLYSIFRDPHKALNAAGLKPGQQVLEIGCGPGFFTIPAAKIVGTEGSVTALDINSYAVRIVERKVKKEGIKNVAFLLADAAQTGLPNQSFDLVFLFGFTHPIGDLKGILREIHRLLKPAGILSVEGRSSLPGKLFTQLKHEGRITQFKKTGLEVGTTS